MDLLLPALAVLGGFVALVWGADRFVMGSAATAQNLGVSPLIVGLTIVGFGTSAPEMLVSSIAAYRGAPGLSIGNAVGSNIANIALVLGLAVLVNPLKVNKHLIHKELPLLIVLMVAAGGLMWDHELGRIDGIVLLGGLFGLIGWIVWDGLRSREIPEGLEDELPGEMKTTTALLWVLVGLAVLLGSSELLVWGAKSIARSFGVTERVIGLTVVAFGTSLPELAATVVAAKRNEHDIAVGNIVGSNMFNTLGVLGLPGVIRPGVVEDSVLHLDFPFMIGVAVLFWLLARVVPPTFRLNRWQGGVLFAAYFVYLGLLYFLGVAGP